MKFDFGYVGFSSIDIAFPSESKSTTPNGLGSST